MNKLKFAILFVCCQFLFFTAKSQLPTINVTKNTNPSNGYTFIATFWSATAGSYYLLILDKQGRIIYAKSFPFSMNGGFLDFKPQPNNKYSFFANKQNQYYIMDKNFNIIDVVEAKNGYSTNNHELFMSDDNHYFIIADETRTIDMSKVVSGGNPNASVIGNIIQKIDTNGNLLFQWKVLDNISLADHVGDLTSPTIDFAHTNSLFLDTDSTILMCNPSLNEITKIDLNTSNIIWRFGLNSKSNQFTFSNDTLGFIFQHYVTRLANGNIMLFDNGLGRYARAVEYEVDEANKNAKLVFQYRNTPDVTGPSMGSVNRLANGNTFIGWGSACKMTEVDTSGNKVFEASFPSCTYRALKYDIPNPIAHLISGPTEICKGQTSVYTAFLNSSWSYSWTITNGTIISGQGTNTITVKWPSEGQGIVKLTKTNSINQKDYLLMYINVLPNPIVKISLEYVCKGAKFIDLTTNSLSRLWDFGDGEMSSLADIKHTYSTPGTYLIKLKVTNKYGCIDSSIKNVIIHDKTKADFSLDSTVCENEQIMVTNNSTDADSFFWNLGNSMTSNLKYPKEFSYTSAGIYNVKLIASGYGCVDTISKNINVNPNPKAYFNFSEICQGAIFSDSSINSVNRLWNFGDGDTSTLTNINHVYNSSGKYHVKLQINNSFGCSDSTVKTIIIPDAPLANFSLDSIVCKSEIIKIINNSTAAETYQWYLQDSMISNLITPFDFSLYSVGNYDIKLTVTGSGCADSLIKKVIVNPKPQAIISFSEICNGGKFYDSSINSIKSIWDFGDGNTSSLNVTDHIYDFSGNYLVKLIVLNSHGCTDSALKSITIHKTPKAFFYIDSVVCANEIISIINNSMDGNNYFWDFGDSRTSYLKTPEPFTYNTTGSYRIKLLASDSLCSDSLAQTIYVRPNPTAKFNYAKLTDSTIQFVDSSYIESGNIDFWVWDFGDGKTSHIQNPVHKYSTNGSYTVKLCITSNDGCEHCSKDSVIIFSTGIDLFEPIQSITVFPNPNNGYLTINSSVRPTLIVICDVVGQEVLKFRPETEIMDLTSLPKGVYIVKLRFEKLEQAYRIIKN